MNKAYSALELLAAPSAKLLSVRIPGVPERRDFVDSIRATLLRRSRLNDKDAESLINSLAAAHVEGPIPRFTAAFNAAGIEITPTELEWLREQRGSFVHPASFDETPEATSRRDVFRRKVAMLRWIRFSVIRLSGANDAAVQQIESVPE